MNRIDHGSCLDLLLELPAGCADLVFADPPFNVGYEYDEYVDEMSREEYLQFTKKWVSRCVDHVMAPDASIYVAIGDEYAAEVKAILDGYGLVMRNWVIWRYTFGVSCRNKFNRCHAHLFYYVKDEKNFTFNADAVKVPSARQEVYGDKRAAAGGKLPDDVWDYSRVCGTFKERTGHHPCQMPAALLERVVKASSDKGGLVVDPFCGSGTTAAVAKALGRRYYSCDVSRGYVLAARTRVGKVEPGLADL